VIRRGAVGLDPLSRQLVDNRGHQFRLGGKLMLQRSEAHAGGDGYGLQVGGRIAPLIEKADRGCEHLVAGLCTAIRL
jgi:hypothetical protein